MLGVGPCLEHEASRRIQDARHDDLAIRWCRYSQRALICCGHVSSPSFLVQPDIYRDDQSFRPRNGDSAPPNNTNFFFCNPRSLSAFAEPTTLVTFELRDVAGGTQLNVVESGFDGIPLSRRLEAYRGNEQGWTMQIEAIEKYVTKAA